MSRRGKTASEIELPPPIDKGEMSLEEAIARRRSVRRYGGEPLSLSQLSQVLWAAQGITYGRAFRATPSAGALYPLEVFVVTGRDGVHGLPGACYHFNVENHSLELHKSGDLRNELSVAALSQEFVAHAPVDMVICALYERTSRRYGRRAEMYVHMEAGHVGQNVHLQAAALGLAVVMVGAFHDEEVARVMDLKEDVKPLYIIPVGKAG